MADLVNPYANPYLPSFVNQRPRVNEPQPTPTPQMNFSGLNFGQIHSVSGFAGARAYNLANGASEILAESDPNLARVYVVAKDNNGQMFVQGFNLIPVEEPKPVTMDDLSNTMSQILDRLNKLEEGQKNEQPVSANSWSNTKQSGNGTDGANVRNGSGAAKPAGGSRPNDGK